MRRTLLASFALAFMAYWFWTAEYSTEREASIQPLIPSLARMLPSLGGSKAPSAPAGNSTADTSALKKWMISEVVNRAHAMEALVQRQSQDESVKFLSDLLAHTTDASIARHARYLLTKL